MTFIFEELDYQKTPLGDISLRRRSEPRLNDEILYEVKLGDEFLMSSLFTEAEIQLSKLGIAALKKAGHQQDLDIVVGGLGLGYTAVAALEDPAVRSLLVIDIMEPVIKWHQQRRVPLGAKLCSDPRTKLVHADFFELASSHGFDQSDNSGRVHAVLLDIDHSPSHWLNSENSSFYTVQSLLSLSDKLVPGGIFGLWSNDPPETPFLDLLESVFESSESHIVTFPNPYKDSDSTNTVYLAKKTNDS